MSARTGASPTQGKRMNLLIATTIFQVIPGFAPRRLSLVLIALVVLVIPLMFRHVRRGRLMGVVVGTCVLCALLFLLLPLGRRQVSRTLQTVELPRIAVYDAPGYAEATIRMDEDFSLNATQTTVGILEQPPAPPPPRLPPEPRSAAELIQQQKPAPHPARLAPHWTLVSAIALAAMVYLAYLFLDAGTRGQFTWPLRIFSVVAFVGICIFLVLYGRGF